MHRNGKNLLNPPRVLALGLLVVIGIGALLLKLPVATATGTSISFVDAVFTATSATAVTGLTVVHTADTFSLFGELVILALIQIGGLGFMTMSVLAALVLGRKITLRERLLIQESLNQNRIQGVVRLTRSVLLFTLAFEGTGAALLAIRLVPDLGWGRGVYFAVFHAVSAFCNAGFDLFSASLTAYRDDYLVNMVIAGLIIFGGLGFAVLLEVNQMRHWRKLSLHSKLVLSSTGILLVFGFAAVLLLEFNNQATLGQFPVGQRFLPAFFQAVVPRTAGFFTLPIGELRPVTLLAMMFLMFIGASSGSTGGGIKTNTFSVLLLSLYSMLIGRAETSAFRRQLPPTTVFKAFAVSSMSLMLVGVAALILLATEKASFERVLFEVFSAFGTVGLSTGITPSLTTTGKLVISVVMYVGRLGPLTLGFALAQQAKRRGQAWHYPEETILIG
ncbi:MAG: Trk family potassium uptake protein [Clostridia bacterium]|nr:MAG: Trk family potassium uptake protein [Clostridia bacterium]